jgi:hypothetical protein
MRIDIERNTDDSSPQGYHDITIYLDGTVFCSSFAKSAIFVAKAGKAASADKKFALDSSNLDAFVEFLSDWMNQWIYCDDWAPDEQVNTWPIYPSYVYNKENNSIKLHTCEDNSMGYIGWENDVTKEKLVRGIRLIYKWFIDKQR